MRAILTALLLLALAPVSISAQIATPSPQETILAPGLVITGYRIDESSSGFFETTALVDNRSDQVFELPWVLATFLDGRGDVLGESTLLSFANEIPAHHRATVTGAVMGDAIEVIKPFATIEFSPRFGTPAELNSGRATSDTLTVSPGSIDESGRVAQMQTRVTNDGTAAVSGTMVIVTVLDDRGELLDAGLSSLVSGLRPGQSANVIVPLTSTASVPKNATIDVFAVATL